MPAGPVMLVGGHGVTGQGVVRLLRARRPDLDLVIAGRDLDRARAFAAGVGAAATTIDLAAPDLGGLDCQPSALVMLAKDSWLHALAWAGRCAIPYISLSSAAFEAGVDFTHAVATAQRAPVVLAGNWFAGAVAASALELASRFDRVDSVIAGVTLDPKGTGGGPASAADFQRIARCSPTTLARIDGAYVWQSADESRGQYRAAGGDLREGKGAVSPDVASIGAGCGAPDVRVLETWGASHHHAVTGTPADEVAVDIRGDSGGVSASGRQVLTWPSAETSLTAICVALLLERAMGLDGAPPAGGGVYTPECLIPPGMFMSRLAEAGAQLETSVS